jgi:hypothetical protein
LRVRYRDHGELEQRSFRTLSEARRFKGTADAGEAQPTSRQPFEAYAEEWSTPIKGARQRAQSDHSGRLQGMR